MAKFRGVSHLSLDAKGRIVLPARHREHLPGLCNNQLIVTIDTDQPCLLIYPLPEWELIEEKIESLPSFNATTRRIQRLLIGHATEIEVDASGRMLLPTPLRDYARLEKKVMLVGQGKKLELWDERLWSESMAVWLDSEGSNDEMPVALAELTL